jgi:hypothetical protein
MWHLLFWVYLVNAVLVINHESDSVCWKEWEHFRLPGGIFALSIHTYSLRQGRQEFTPALSRIILVATLVVSLV